MRVWQGLAIGVAIALLAYAILLAWLVVAGKGRKARTVARFVPDFVILFRRLLSDHRVPRRTKLLLAALIAYLVMPFDLVPDFIPVAGYLDDAVVIAFALRHVLRRCGPGLIEELWPGTPASRAVVLRLAGMRAS
jgi:uncharacterized membrane protein YkvA (DUF1232 family)